MHEQPDLSPAPEPLSRLERFKAFANRPLGRLTTAMVAVALVASGDGRFGAVNRFDDSMDAHIELGNESANVHFVDWDQSSAFLQDPTTPYIQPNAAVEAIVSTNEPLTNEIGLTPPRIENPDKFFDWVHNQGSRSELLEAVGIGADSPTPRQLVNLAAAIVGSNLAYTYDSTQDAYGKPMDVNLEEGTDLQCEGFSAATIAVFGELKKMYPVQLKNTYMTTQTGQMMGHVWTTVAQVTGPSEVELSFIDTAADDPNFLDEVNPTFLELIEGLHGKGIISPEVFKKLAQQYQDSKELSSEDKAKINMDNGMLIGKDWIS